MLHLGGFTALGLALPDPNLPCFRSQLCVSSLPRIFADASLTFRTGKEDRRAGVIAAAAHEIESVWSFERQVELSAPVVN